MFSLKKKSLTKVICAALTFMSALPFGVANAGNTVKVTDSGPNNTELIDINATTKTGAVKGNENNKLTIENITGKYSGYNWYAARVEWGSINKNFLLNDVTVTKSTVGDIYGAWFHYECSGSLDNGNFAGGVNTITIDSGSVVNGNIYGAYTDQGRGYENKIYINGSTVKGNIYGSYSNTNSDDLNIIDIKNSTVKGDIYGGRSGSDLTYYWGQKKRVVAAKAHDNTVNIISGEASGNIYGGYSVGGTAYNNKVNIKGGTVGGAGKYIYGGYSNTGSVSGNIVTVDGIATKVNSDYIYGSWSNNDSGYSTINIISGTINSDIYGSYSTNTRSYNNKLNMSGGTIGAADRESNIYGSYSPNGVAFSNTFNISGDSKIYADVYGSYSKTGDAYANTFNITGGTIGTAESVKNVYGGYSEKGNAYSNIINIDGGTIYGDVYGGKSSDGTAYNNIVNISAGTVGSIYGGYSKVNSASDNTVNISGGTLTSVCGAYVYSGQANNNTVNLLKPTTVDYLFGGTGAGASSTDNTLNVYDYGNTVNEKLNGFQNINFIVPDKSTETMLSVRGTGNISGVNIQTGITAADLKQGDVITLYSGTDVSGAIIPVGDVLSASKIGDITGFYDYLGRYSIDGNKILFTVASEADVPGDYCLTVTGGTITNIFGKTPTVDSYTDDKSNKEFAIKFKKSSWTNQLTIDLGTVGTYQNYNWYAVRTTGSEAAHGIVNMKSGTAKNIYGGYAAGAGAISDSTVTMTGGTVTDVYGGYAAGSGAASGNTVTVSGGSVTDVYGGYSASGKADKNKVDVENTTVSGTVYGGKIIGVADASANTVNIKDGTVKGEVYGGYTSGVRYQTSRSYNNTVNIDGSIVEDNIYGGSARLEIFANREIFNNTVNINNSKVESSDPNKKISVYGGHSDWGYTSKVNNNTLNITGSSTVTADLYGGRSKETCPVYYNTVTIDALGGTVTGNIYGGWSEYSDIKGNTVNINNGTVTGNIWGGYTNFHHSYNNTVNINGGSVTGNIYGSYSQEYNSYGNTVTLNGGTVNGDVYGGKSDSQYSYACYGNTVNINGGTVNGDVYGGKSESNKAYNNTVNLLTQTTVNNLYGGVGVGATSTGNTLNVKEAGNEVKGELSGFQRVNFDVPNAPLEAGNAILKVKSADFSEFSVINLDKIPTYSLTLLSSTNDIVNYDKLKYYIGGIEYTDGGKTPIKENGHVAVKEENFVSAANEIKWTLGDESFYTGVYYEANGNVIRADGNKAVLTSVPTVSKVYGSYSENAGKSATDGIVELAGKVTSDTLQLIGGANSAGGTVGSNMLNVLGKAAGSSVKTVDKFDTINLYSPGYSDESTPLLNAGTINFAAGSTINLDVIPAYSMTLLKWGDRTGEAATYKFAGVAGNLNEKYLRAMADEVNHRVAVAKGQLTFDKDRDKSLKWTVEAGAFYTGIYHPRKDAAFPDIVKVMDNKVILDSETAKGVNTVYGSYSANGDVTATNGTVELAGKIDRAGETDGLDLIGGANSVSAGNVGSNTLNVLGSAVGSSVKKVDSFSTINLYAPGNSTDTTPLLYAKTINFAENSTINLDIIPLYSMTLLKWGDKNEAAVKYKFAGVEGELDTEYVKATADEVSHHVAVAKGKLSETDSSLKWNVTDNSFYTGIFYPREGAAFPGANVKDNKVILDSETAKGTNTVYGSYSANAAVMAEKGIVELAGKIDRAGETDGLDLIGGYNSADMTNVGSNTLNVLGTAAGSTVKSIKDFSEFKFYVPDAAGSALLSATEKTDISGAKIWLEYAPAYNLTLLSNVNNSGKEYWIGDTKLEASGEKYNYSNIANNNTNVLVSKGHIDTSADISWINDASILTGKYIDETGKTYSAVNDTIVLDNRLTIPAGTSKIYGSYNEKGDATGGTVDIAGSFVRTDIELIGGYSKNSGTVSGNTLNVRSVGNVFKGISGFDNMNFYVPKEAKNEDTMLAIVNPGDEDAEVDLSGVKQIKAGIATGSTLKKDNTINLLATHNGFSGDVPTDMKADLIGTGLVKVDATITQSENKRNIVLKLNKDVPTVLSEESKSLVETRAAGMALLNNGADLVTGKGFINAKAAAEAENIAIDKHTSFTPYAAVGVNNMRYETGSYVDSNGWGINVGFSRVLNYKDSKLTLAPFVEYGKANYDSYLDNGTHGYGDNSFTGIGFMAKSEQNDGLYYEGSVRLGRSKGDYEGGELLGRYDTSSNYLAFHAGIGKVNKLSQKSSIDYYGKLFYTHQNSDDVTVTRHEIGDSFVYNFDAINSCRLRLGARWNQQLGARDVFYAGLAWDYEFGSEARAHYNGLSTPAPTMRGSSGMLELGWKQEATKENPFGVDLGLTGWCGKQRGISFNAGFSWAF